MNQTLFDQLNQWLARPEGLNLEFKEATVQFDRRHDLPDYCAALANEGGGKLILGVDKARDVVGTRAFIGTYNKLSNELLNEIGIRIDVEEIQYTTKRVLIFHVPSRPLGHVVRSTGHYGIPMRAGESLREMDDQTLKTILNELTPDFSASIVPGFSICGIDGKALTELRRLCHEKTKNPNFMNCTPDLLLDDLGLKTNQGLTYAALILLGNEKSLNELLPQSEIILEWRQLPGKIAHDFRKSWREPFLNILSDAWVELDKRNIRTPFQEGFVQREIFAFDRDSIREAVLNAVAHRDYSRRGEVIFISASPEGFLIESPGGFLPGITPENAVFKRAWRNQRLAEALEKAGLVERSGQGLNLIYDKAIRSGKGMPDLSQSTVHSVSLFIPAQLKDSQFVLYLEKIVSERQINLSFEEIYELEKVREQQKVAAPAFRKKFLNLGIIEKVGVGRGTEYILSQNYYAHQGKLGVHTKLSGIGRDKTKELMLKHFRDKKKGDCKQFQDTFPELKSMNISNLLQELKKEGKIRHVGSKSHGYWELV